MEQVWKILSEMTVWNWITLIAFIFLPLSVLNAALSLKSRWKDWRGTKNKVAFTKRVDEFREKVSKLKDYKQNPTRFFIEVTADAVNLGCGALIGLSLLTLGVLLFMILDIGSVFVLLALLCFIFSIGMLSRTQRLVAQMHTPELLAAELVNFVKNASKQGITSPEADALIVDLARSEFLTEAEREKVFDNVSENYPKLLSPVYRGIQNATK